MAITKQLTPRECAIRDMKAEKLDVSVLELRRKVIVEEEIIFLNIEDGRVLNGGKCTKRTITTQTILV